MKRYDYCRFYKQLTGRIRAGGAACFVLHAASGAATGVMYAAYPLLLILLCRAGDRGVFLRALLIPGAAFVLLTVIRARIDRPRPYETWPIDPLIHKRTRGRSMPSRHVFSSALIATAWFLVSAPAACALLAVSAAAAWIRVVGGVHYPSDVAVGYLAGTAAGLLVLAL